MSAEAGKGRLILVACFVVLIAPALIGLIHDLQAVASRGPIKVRPYVRFGDSTHPDEEAEPDQSTEPATQNPPGGSDRQAGAVPAFTDHQRAKRAKSKEGMGQ